MDINDILRSQLTPEQYDAAVDPAREVLCLACAGSGKSRTLAYRIARLLAEGANPSGLVAFTFTDKAAESIKRRVSEALKEAGMDPTVIGAMYIGTIHSYCQRVLGEIDPTYRQYDVLDENRLKLYLISRYPQLKLQDFKGRPGGDKYFERIKQASDAWKTANDELMDFAAVSLEDVDVGGLLERIKSGLNEDQYIDFSTMIRNVVEAIQNNSHGVPAGIGALKHLMVDEYQDVNPSQEQLIRLLHQRSTSLFVVGDDDQAIYGWRGADVSNIIDFPHRYPNCSRHTLSQNFRSTDPIVNASNSFVEATLGPSRIPKSPNATRNLSPQDLGVLWFPTRAVEAEWVASRIHDLLGTEYDVDGHVRGLTPGDFAILMRSTRGQEQDHSPRHTAFTSALGNLSIRFSLEAGGGPFDRPQTQALRSSFELLRTITLDRTTVEEHFREEVLPAYPHASFTQLVKVLTDWHRLVHQPSGSTRLRLYPQQLVYDLLEAFKMAESNLSDEAMRDIGLFSRMILDVETVYMSVDSTHRFADVLNFLQHPADTGYDVSTDDLTQRPDVVTISTVHKMKGLEFPCVFVVDVEANRFPGTQRKYSGWLPSISMSSALTRGAYQSTPEEEARLFYTGLTRAERYLYVTGCENLPGGQRNRKPSSFALRICQYPSTKRDDSSLPSGLQVAVPRQRIVDSDYPTSFTEVKYYLECPKSYQFRQRYGFSPAVPEMFGYGRTVHTSIQMLHALYPNSAPGPDEVEQVVDDTFHLKHVPPSGDPENRPGAYENAKNSAGEMAKGYVSQFHNDFSRQRQVEASFEIPATNCVISGSIDLLLHEDTNGRLLQAEIIDFKTMEGGQEPTTNVALDWTELALQVQLYARAAEQVLGQNARTGSVHLLKDNQRVEVPISPEAVEAAVQNVEWAVNGILQSDFPMRPQEDKCNACDFKMICSKTPQEFSTAMGTPPELHLPDRKEMARAFSLFER